MKKATLFFSAIGGSGVLVAGLYFGVLYIDKKIFEHDPEAFPSYISKNPIDRGYKKFSSDKYVPTHAVLDRLSDEEIKDVPFSHIFDFPHGYSRFYWIKRSDIVFPKDTSSRNEKIKWDCRIDTDKGIRKNNIACLFLSFPRRQDKKCNVTFRQVTPFSFHNIKNINQWPEHVLLQITGFDHYAKNANISKITLFKNEKKYFSFDEPKLEKANCTLEYFSTSIKKIEASITDVKTIAPTKELFSGRQKNYLCKLDGLIIEACSIYSGDKFDRLIKTKSELKKDLKVQIAMNYEDYYKFERLSTKNEYSRYSIKLGQFNNNNLNMTIESKDSSQTNKVYATLSNFSKKDIYS